MHVCAQYGTWHVVGAGCAADVTVLLYTVCCSYTPALRGAELVQCPPCTTLPDTTSLAVDKCRQNCIWIASRFRLLLLVLFLIFLTLKALSSSHVQCILLKSLDCWNGHDIPLGQDMWAAWALAKQPHQQVFIFLCFGLYCSLHGHWGSREDCYETNCIYGAAIHFSTFCSNLIKAWVSKRGLMCAVGLDEFRGEDCFGS